MTRPLPPCPPRHVTEPRRNALRRLGLSGLLGLASAAAWAQAAPEPPRLATLPLPAGYTVIDAVQPSAAQAPASANERAGRPAPVCTATPGPPPASASASPASTAAVAAGEPSVRGSEPQVTCTLIETEAGRIEELRVRGQLQRARVQPGGGARAYEIQLLDAGRDPAAKSGPGRGGDGQRVWPVLAF